MVRLPGCVSITETLFEYTRPSAKIFLCPTIECVVRGSNKVLEYNNIHTKT